jgi:hypothetical protein
MRDSLTLIIYLHRILNHVKLINSGRFANKVMSDRQWTPHDSITHHITTRRSPRNNTVMSALPSESMKNFNSYLP